MVSTVFQKQLPLQVIVKQLKKLKSFSGTFIKKRSEFRFKSKNFPTPLTMGFVSNFLFTTRVLPKFYC